MATFDLIGVFDDASGSRYSYPQPLVIPQTEDCIINIEITTSDYQPLDLTDGVLNFAVKKNANDTSDPVINRLGVILDAVNGLAKFVLSQSDTENLIAGSYVFTVWYTGPSADGSLRTRLVPISILQLEFKVSGPADPLTTTEVNRVIGPRWYVDAGVPSPTLGSIGELYLDSATGDVYEKTNSGWGSPVANLTAAGFPPLTGIDNSVLAEHPAGTLAWIQVAGGVLSGLTTTGLANGDFGDVSAANTVLKTDSASIATALVVGANVGTVGSMNIGHGTSIAAAKFTTVGGSPSNGARVWLAAGTDDGSTGAGKLTATEPLVGVSAEVGIVLDNANYTGLKTCKILFMPRAPVEL